MNIVHKLPIYPLPQKGESFKGYVTRLAFINGLDGLANLLRCLGYTNNSKLIFKVGSPKSTAFINVLSRAVGISSEEMNKYFEQEREIAQTKYISVRHIKDASPIVCQSCLKRNGFIKSEWHYYYSSYCNEHKEKLHKACPSCGALFEWKSSIFKGCTSCGKAWGSFKTIKSKKSTFVESLNHLEGREFDSLYNKVTENLKVGLRPFDASFVNVRDIDKFVPDITPHVDFTYLLTQSKQSIEYLKGARINNFINSINGYAPVTIINQAEAANDDLFEQLTMRSTMNESSWSAPQSSSHNVLTAHRRKNTCGKHAHLELSWQQLKLIINIDIADIKKLIQRKVLPKRTHYNNSNKISPSRLDEVIHLFNEIKKYSHTDCSSKGTLINWSNRNAFRELKIRRVDVLTLAAERKIRVFSPEYEDHSFDQFKFCPNELKRNKVS